MNRPLLRFIRGVWGEDAVCKAEDSCIMMEAASACSTQVEQTGEQPRRHLHALSIPAGGPESQRQRRHAGVADRRDVCKVKHLKPLKVQHFIEQETAVCFLMTKTFAGRSRERHHRCIHLLYSTRLVLIQKILQALILIRDKVQWR